MDLIKEEWLLLLSEMALDQTAWKRLMLLEDFNDFNTEIEYMQYFDVKTECKTLLF